MKNLYEILEIHFNASEQEIKNAFKQKAKIYHPDKNNGSPASETMFKWINMAKEILLDPIKREKHDYECGVKQKPEETKFKEEEEEVNTNQIFGWALLAFVAGLVVSSSFKN